MKITNCPPTPAKLGTFAAALLASALCLLPRVVAAQSLTLANPHWNITLTDAGYSDFLLDNTPGFEGREYLCGEWGGAIGYQLAGGTVVSPLWLEKQFAFPDWITDSNFGVKSSIRQTGLNADSLPIAESILTNSHLEVTLRHEMLDTITGTPMGTTRALAGGSGSSLLSSRYVLKQTCTIKNISSAALSNVQLFQFLHGLHSQKGVYDNRAYSGTLGNFQYDVMLSGVDPYAISTNSSSAGLEDFLGFHASVAPSGFEIGHYGIEGNGIDDHVTGKPSDGVHLSVENNWLALPYSTRQGTDEFAPAQRWVSGAQRWNLGALANGQSVSLDVILSLRTGTRVTAGSNSTGGCNGGSGVPGGIDYDFESVETEGSCFSDYSKADEVEVATRIASGEFEPFTFLTPGGPAQIWNVSFTGTNSGAIHLTFAYDPTILPSGLDQSTLSIYHFKDHAWLKLAGIVDLVRHTITVTTPSLSAFALGVSGGTTYSIDLSGLPISGGAVSGGGTFASGATVTLIATPGTGYVFTNWTEGAAMVCSSPTYSFTAQANRTLVANFVSAGGNVIITTASLPAGGGATFGDGAYAPGTLATVVAIPNAGYKFSKWLVNGVNVSLSRTNTFTVTTNRVMVAKFKPVYTVTVAADPPSGGTAEADSSTYEPGDLAMMTAIPEPGWCFVNWTQNGLPVSTDPDFQFTVTANRDLVGHFALGYRIDATVYLGIGGTVTGGDVYQSGDIVTLEATANPGYVFWNWTENGTPVSSARLYAFTCTAARILKANFIAQPSVSLVPTAPDTLEITWPAGASGWVLQECYNLNQGAWTNSTRTVNIVGTSKQVTITPSTGSAFFRLARP
jgi:Divergent InlB B-repeat domain